MRISISILSLLLAAVPFPASAQGLVTCHEAGSCSFCRLLEMVSDITEWIIIIATLSTVLILAYAGFTLITSAGNRAALEKGKQMFFNCIIGILIILASWTIIDTGIKLFTGNELGMWNQVQCGAGEFAVGNPEGYGVTLTEYEIGIAENETPVLISVGHPGIDGGDELGLVDCAVSQSQFRTVNAFGNSVTVHQSLVPSIQRMDANWQALGGSSFYRVDTSLGLQCRNVAGTNRRSNHAFGIAVDINPSRNPFMGNDPGEPNVCVTDMPQAFVQLWLNEGWGWGCNWTSGKDAMHFSKHPREGGSGTY